MNVQTFLPQRLFSKCKQPGQQRARRNRKRLHTLERLERREVFAVASLVQDINTSPNYNAIPFTHPVVSAGTLGFFAYDSTEEGNELWVTDGTSAGTRLVKDIQPGSQSSSPNSFLAQGSQIFFAAMLNDTQRLWVSDGSEAGTVSLANLAYPELFVFDSRVYFAGSDEVGGTELWSTDGTVAGTSRIDLRPGLDSSGPQLFSSVGGTLTFRATLSDGGTQLVGFDPTSNSVLSLAPNVYPQSVTQLGTQLLVNTGNDLWITDGTVAGTHVLVDPNSNLPVTTFNLLTVIDDRAMLGRILNGHTEVAMVAVDGTLETLLSFPSFASIAVSPRVNGIAIVQAVTGSEWALYRTDGTAAGTQLIPTPLGFASMIESSATWKEAIYFQGVESGVRALWRYEPGTLSLTNLPATQSLTNVIGKPVATNTSLYWSNTGNTVDGSYLQFTTDGVNSQNISQTYSFQSGVSSLAVLNDDLLFFGASDGGHALRVVEASDAVALTPVITLPTIDAFNFDSWRSSVKFQNRRYFFADSDSNSEVELWRSDGSAGGTTLISNMQTLQRRLVATDSAVFLVAQTPSGYGLWRVEDNSEVIDLVPVASLPFVNMPNLVEAVADTIVLSGPEPSGAITLRASDGQASTTTLLTSLPGYATSPIQTDDGTIYFGTDSGSSQLVWKTNGTEAGTSVALSGLGSNWLLATTDGKSIFWLSIDNESHLWRSDDGLQSQRLIATGTFTNTMIADDGLLYFTQYLGNNLFGIMRTDGSIGAAQQIGTSNSPVGYSIEFYRIGDTISVLGSFDDGVTLMSDVGGDALVPNDRLSAFVTLNGWEDIELRGAAVAPAYFPAFGVELGRLDLSATINIDNRVVEENVGPTAVGQLSLIWSSSSEPVTFSLVNGDGDTDNALFEVGPTGQLNALVAFDNETRPRLSVRIRASSDLGTLAESSLTLFVRDIFDGVESISYQGGPVAENAALGTVIGTVSAQTLPERTIQYVVVSVDGQTTALPLSMNGSSLVVSGALDFESDRQKQVVVRATDSAGTFDTISFSVDLLNINENLGQPIALSNSSVQDESPDNFESWLTQLVGDLSVIDSTGSWTFALVAGAGDYDNALFSIADNQLNLTDVSDYEVRDNYSLRVQANNGTETIEAFLTIDITPVDEFEPAGFFFFIDGVPQSFPILMENSPIGQPATTVQVDDLDRGETFVLSGAFADLAVIVGNAFVPVTTINYETLPSTFGLPVSVAAVSNLSGRNYARFYDTSAIGNVNDPPILNSTPADQEILGGDTTTFSIALDTFYEEDQGDSFSVTALLDGQPLPGWLLFDAGSGLFTASPQTENAGDYVITLVATDSVGASTSISFALSVLSGQSILAIGGAGNDVVSIVANATGTQWTVTQGGTVLFSGDLTGIAVRVDGGDGIDTVIVQGTTGSDNVQVRGDRIRLGSALILVSNVERQDIQGQGGSDNFSIQVSTTVAAARDAGRNPPATPVPGIFLTGGNGIDSLNAAAIDNTFTITGSGQGTLNDINFVGFENLNGNSLNDSFIFGRRGTISGAIDGAAGFNTLDVSARTSAVTATLDSADYSAGVIAGVANFRNIGVVTANASENNVVVGPDAPTLSSTAVQWIINSGISVNSLVQLNGFRTIRAGQADDIFSLDDPATNYSINGGSGLNRLEHSQAYEQVVVDLEQQRATGLSSFRNLNVFYAAGGNSQINGARQNTVWTMNTDASLSNSQGYRFENYQRVMGSSRNDTFELSAWVGFPLSVDGGGGEDTVKTLDDGIEDVLEISWQLTEKGSGYAGPLQFSGVESLIGGADRDYMQFSVTLPRNEWYRSISGRASAQTMINYPYWLTAVETEGAELDLQRQTASGIGRWSNIANFVAELPADRLIGRSSARNWTIDMSGNLSSDGSQNFSGFETIVAGGSDDLFTILASAEGVLELGPRRIVASGGDNTLDLSAYPVAVDVNLLTGSASLLPGGIAGFKTVFGTAFDDTLAGDNFDNILVGGKGNDVLRGLGGHDVLIGAAGDDQLYGGNGNDLLLGGSGIDQLFGGAGDDLLIADLSSLLANELTGGVGSISMPAIRTVMNEWTSNRTYTQRIQRLQTGVGAGNSIKLNNSTITSDASIDTLLGEAGDDWFWLGPNDLSPDVNAARERRQRLL